MKETAGKIQAVINALEGLEIQSKKNTMLQLLGCIQVLEEVMNEINAPKEDQDGNDHAE